MSNQEIELTEEEVKQMTKDLQIEKKSDVIAIDNITNNKPNKEFKKVGGLPILKKGFPFKKMKYGKELNWQQELEKELLKEEPSIDKVKQIRKRIKKKGEIEEIPIKSPVVEMIRADGSVEWFEGVKAGTLEITRSDDKLSYISLDKGKLLTDSLRNTDGTVIQKWIVFENDHMPLPTNVFMDSHTVYSNYEEVMTNRKDVQTERIKARGDLIWKIMIPIVIIFAIAFLAVPVITGQSIGDMLPTANAEEQQQTYCTTCTGELGALTPEEISIIRQFRIDTNRNNQGDA